MSKFIEMEASSVDLAVEKALAELGVSKDKVSVEVLEKGGLFSKAKVKVTVNENIAENMAEFVNGVLERMGLVSRASVTDKDDTLYISIHGEDSGSVIGYRGETLDAFQYLCLTFLNVRKTDFKKVVVNCEDYREKREETLTALALRLADKAVRLRRKIELEPMNPFERRVIHSALAQSDIATTESEGEDSKRHIVIIPLGVELKDNRPLKDGERHDGHDKHSRKGEHNRRDRKGNRRSERKPGEDEPEVEDGNVYRFFTENDDFVKPAAQAGPPKFKSFGGKKRF